MCGIAGWLSYGRDLERERPTVEAMTATMALRGPDAFGVWTDRHIALGHRRLSIIDLEGGRQPMVEETPTGTVALTYSGEAYNFTELRDELVRRGHRFRTTSDTEVVLHAYLEWGEKAAEHLNGMYAFAVWDGRTERLILVRDRLGIKPLYYYPTVDGVLFGSEPKAILANPLAERVVDVAGLRELLTFTKDPGQAVWAGMSEVKPGTVVTVDRNGHREHTYWRLEPARHTDDVDKTVTRVGELLEDAVARQLVADVPRCVLLSGGLDSSSITALAAGHLGSQGERLRSFSVDFTSHEESFTPDQLRVARDTPFAHDVAGHVNSDHTDILIDHRQLADPELRRAVVAARDLPAGMGDIDMSLLLLFRAVRERSTVALSGESADELFGGYRWFHDPAAQQADFFPWLINLGENGDYSPLGVVRSEVLGALDLGGHLHESFARVTAEVGTVEGESDFEYRMRRSSYVHLTRFVRTMLDRKDRMSMAAGLEVRVPFCDHRLVEYVYNTPWSMKTFDGREKSLLRAATQDRLPRSVVERAKNFYPSTQDPDYVTALQQQAGALLATSGHPAFQLVDEGWLRQVLTIDAAKMPLGARNGIERALDAAVWFDLYGPELRLS
ncbi:asparagine synthase (glutamine-hydrolyzing) [Streptomyces rimosus]|uniref:asparagine synthase (glutamine-hydrolyzing) n=1 Tax=Streptomyces rimosus TaxID=1927 RepID=UPI0004C6E60B|nr:asparagine synthase (glutamine-hydrolyzing) [Streptomyces rimosus]